jgi:hypothetical protein
MPPKALWELYDVTNDQVVAAGSLWDCQLAGLELKNAEDVLELTPARLVCRPATRRGRALASEQIGQR